MKIALLGYGKMGKIIESIALERGHAIVLKIDENNVATFTDSELKNADVAIEFSTPASAVSNMKRCFQAGIPVVVGTTGWYEEKNTVYQLVKSQNASLFHASNFSLGVNLFFRLNKQLATLMNLHKGYSVSMEEIHHIHKLDSPSGTAITLAQGLIENLEEKTKWEDYPNGIPKAISQHEIPIHSKRIDEVPGTHSITYQSEVDQITITHEAFNRKGFALGAVLAAEWISGKKGVFGMDDLLG
jgi:4-hydroxy-tetrahydrodipicolinate reductase